MRTNTKRIAIGLLLGLSLLSACASGTDPWDTTGWQNNMLDYETDFWEPMAEPPAQRPPSTQPPPSRAPRPAPTWTTPQPGVPTPPPPPSQPGATVPAAPRAGPAIPPPPPPPYTLPR